MCLFPTPFPSLKRSLSCLRRHADGGRAGLASRSVSTLRQVVGCNSLSWVCLTSCLTADNCSFPATLPSPQQAAVVPKRPLSAWYRRAAPRPSLPLTVSFGGHCAGRGEMGRTALWWYPEMCQLRAAVFCPAAPKGRTPQNHAQLNPRKPPPANCGRLGRVAAG